MRKLWERFEKFMGKLWESCEQNVRKFWRSFEKVVRMLWKSFEKAVRKLQESCDIIHCVEEPDYIKNKDISFLSLASENLTAKCTLCSFNSNPAESDFKSALSRCAWLDQLENGLSRSQSRWSRPLSTVRPYLKSSTRIFNSDAFENPDGIPLASHTRTDGHGTVVFYEDWLYCGLVRHANWAPWCLFIYSPLWISLRPHSLHYLVKISNVWKSNILTYIGGQGKSTSQI